MCGCRKNKGVQATQSQLGAVTAQEMNRFNAPTQASMAQVAARSNPTKVQRKVRSAAKRKVNKTKS